MYYTEKLQVSISTKRHDV